MRVCYFPALINPENLTFYKRQADWYLAPLGKRADVTFPDNETQARSGAEAADIILFWKKEAYWGAKAAHRRKGLVAVSYTHLTLPTILRV